MGARIGHVPERLGVFVPGALSLSTLLGLVLVLVHARVAVASNGAWWALPIDALIHFGGSLPAGLATGVLASLGSTWVGRHGVGIGASGAIMGLVGVVAGHGHRLGTTIGRNDRNAMMKWIVYVLVFGYFIGADNVAHVVGLLSGLIIGYAARPAALAAPRWRMATLASAVIGELGTAATVLAVMVPLPRPADDVLPRVAPPAASRPQPRGRSDRSVARSAARYAPPCRGWSISERRK
jgi:hypothetical protein